jgi:hypothetical protein
MNHTISIVLELNVCLDGQRGLLAICVLHSSSGMPAFLQVEQLGVRLLMGFFFSGACEHNWHISTCAGHIIFRSEHILTPYNVRFIGQLILLCSTSFTQFF